ELGSALAQANGKGRASAEPREYPEDERPVPDAGQKLGDRIKIVTILAHSRILLAGHLVVAHTQRCQGSRRPKSAHISERSSPSSLRIGLTQSIGQIRRHCSMQGG